MNHRNLLTIVIGLMLSAMALTVSAQVSNDNEDEVNIVNQWASRNFVPGQVLVKFKDESNIQIHRSGRGQFRAASINSIDKVLREYGICEMEKLFPAEEAKPKARLGRKKAPNGTLIEERNLDKVYLVKLSSARSDSTLQFVERLKEIADVEYAEPNYMVYITTEVNANLSTSVNSESVRRVPVATETTASVICSVPSQNPLYFRQYGITQQKVHQLWSKPIINKKRPVIAILDTGVDITHPDLVDNIWSNNLETEGETAYDDDRNGVVDDINGWNFVDSSNDLTDRNGHGTHVAGIAAAADNNIGIVGANPLALIMPVKVMNDRGQGDVATISRGIVYAAENGADVINMSFGTAGLALTMMEALNKAYQTAILVASAGNNGKSIYDSSEPPGISYPAAYYLVLGVEASGSNLQRVGYSNFDPDGPIYSEDGIDGRNYEVMVPGDKIYSTLPGGKYNQLNGTSMASPLLAGAVSALLMVKDYPSKDILFGDLIHLKANFADIYNSDTPRTPKIDLVSMTVDDSGAGNNNDGMVDVGETICFTPVLRNTWVDATNIQLNLTVDDAYQEFVQIENPSVAFGYSISAYGRATAKTPIRVQFAENIGDNTRIKFVLKVSCAENAEEFSQDFYITVNNMVKISGLITEDRTLTADHVYLVNGDLGIAKGATLTIEPGARLEFETDKKLSSFGKLIANGTPEKPIVFTGHNGASWKGVFSHSPEDQIESNIASSSTIIYRNLNTTLFTFRETEQTPYRLFDSFKKIFYSKNVINDISINLKDYVIYRPNGDYTSCQDYLTDIDYLGTAYSRLVAHLENKYQVREESDDEYSNPVNVTIKFTEVKAYVYSNPIDEISYCKFEGASFVQSSNSEAYPIMSDCSLTLKGGTPSALFFRQLFGARNTITDMNRVYLDEITNGLTQSNIINHTVNLLSNISYLPRYSRLYKNNYFNVDQIFSPTEVYKLANTSSTPDVDIAIEPSYLGTSREEIIRPSIWEMGNAPSSTYGKIDLNNMRTTPVAEAHGIVWKVCVNGKDAQDEYDELAPLGVGRHKFEVYFNRPMNKAVSPHISFGVREPYTQQFVAEDGSWNSEGTIYTAYKTITGLTKSDGENRIFVQGAEDDEYFECPYEKSRFNIIIQAAGSMATGFAAEAGMGRVDLTWNNEENDFADAMGFNIYRYTVNDVGKADTVRVNREIVDIEATEYTDYDVIPGMTYYYYYKVLSTDLQEYDVSNVVAVTPLTATRGDANGSGDVDVADVITTVNYAAGLEPKPFIFAAADMNSDQLVDILDVIGIIQVILNPTAGARIMAEATAIYSIEDGTLYVDSPVELAGVQVQLSLPSSLQEQGDIVADSNLKGFEQASAWQSESDYLFLAYNMNGKTLAPGKNALLHIGDSRVVTLRLSDAFGQNVRAEGSETTSIDRMGYDVMNIQGIYDLQGRKLSSKAQLPRGIYIINGVKVVK